MLTRTLTPEDQPALEGLLGREPQHNVFHLSALREHGMYGPGREDGAWAVGAFRDGELAGIVTALRGTGGLYHAPGDSESLHALSQIAQDKAKAGLLSLLSGHSSQVDPVLPMLHGVQVGPTDRCHFRILDFRFWISDYENRESPVDDVKSKIGVPSGPLKSKIGRPRLATSADMERLIDFYEVGFYSLAQLPTRAAWRYRLSEQIAYRTMFLIEDAEGKVVSAAQSSAEAYGVAMLGGVATLPEYRGRGLSVLCVGALCDYLFSKGMDSIALFYLKDNDAAGRVYEKLGFQEAGEWLLVSLGMGALFKPLLGMSSR